MKRWIPHLAQATTDFTIPRLRRLDRLYRDQFDRLLRGPLEALVQGFIRMQQPHEGLALGEENLSEDEIDHTRDITDSMTRFLSREYRDKARTAERAGNTKTYGLVRGTFKVDPDLPTRLQTALFQPGRQYRAYIRFAGPGPRVVPDIEDNGILSIGIKLMGVPGRKLMEDEQFTVDLSGISAPTFTTPNVRENAKLQQQLLLGTPAWYFLNPLDSHYLDMFMQGLYARAYNNPLEATYHSCVPYLYGREKGHNRAIKYALIPRIDQPSRIRRFSDNYLRDAMTRTLARTPVVFDFAIQFQIDPVSMPIENAAVVWSRRASPFITVATLEIPCQRFDYPAQDAFARQITINPWHTLATHRPLGNQNRARRAIYYATSRMRQAINQERHVEPTGDEIFNTGAGNGTDATAADTSTQPRVSQ